MNVKYLLAIDQGTSSIKTVIFNSHGEVVYKYTELLRSYFPKTGIARQNPLEMFNILSSVANYLDEFTKTIFYMLINIARDITKWFFTTRIERKQWNDKCNFAFYTQS